MHAHIRHTHTDEERNSREQSSQRNTKIHIRVSKFVGKFATRKNIVLHGNFMIRLYRGSENACNSVELILLA